MMTENLIQEDDVGLEEVMVENLGDTRMNNSSVANGGGNTANSTKYLKKNSFEEAQKFFETHSKATQGVYEKYFKQIPYKIALIIFVAFIGLVNITTSMASLTSGPSVKDTAVTFKALKGSVTAFDKFKQQTDCVGLHFAAELDRLVSSHEQIFIVGPSMSASTSMKRFTTKCLNTLSANFMNDEDALRESLFASIEPQPVLTSAVNDDKTFIKLAKHSTRGSLIIYMHREETDRVLASIRHAFATRICKEGGDDCVLDEDLVVQFIEQRSEEIGMGSTDILTCDTYDALEENDPDIVFVNYQHANELQRIIAKHWCPKLLKEHPM